MELHFCEKQAIFEININSFFLFNLLHNLFQPYKLSDIGDDFMQRINFDKIMHSPEFFGCVLIVTNTDIQISDSIQ